MWSRMARASPPTTVVDGFDRTASLMFCHFSRPLTFWWRRYSSQLAGSHCTSSRRRDLEVRLSVAAGAAQWSRALELTEVMLDVHGDAESLADFLLPLVHGACDQPVVNIGDIDWSLRGFGRGLCTCCSDSETLASSLGRLLIYLAWPQQSKGHIGNEPLGPSRR